MIKKNLKKLNFNRFYKPVPLLKIPNFKNTILDIQNKQNENMKYFNFLNDENYTKYEKYLKELKGRSKTIKKTKKIFPNIYYEYRQYFKSNNFSTVDTSASARKNDKLKTSYFLLNSNKERPKRTRNVTFYINPSLNNYSLNTFYKSSEMSEEKKNEKILKLLDEDDKNNVNKFNTINYNEEINENNKRKKNFYKMIKERRLNLKKIGNFSVDFTNTIFNKCNVLKDTCIKFETKINNKPKFKFVSEKEIQNMNTKKDLGFKGKIKKNNNYINIKVLKEAKAIANLDSDLAFNANKVIKDALNKQNKKKKIIEELKIEEENFKKQQKIQQELMKKTEEIMNDSIIRKNDCIKSINKFYE